MNEAGCLTSANTADVVVYPQQIWYGRVTHPRPTCRGVSKETVVHGRILADLLIPAECLNTKGRVGWERGDAELAEACRIVKGWLGHSEAVPQFSARFELAFAFGSQTQPTRCVKSGRSFLEPRAGRLLMFAARHSSVDELGT